MNRRGAENAEKSIKNTSLCSLRLCGYFFYYSSCPIIYTLKNLLPYFFH